MLQHLFLKHKINFFSEFVLKKTRLYKQSPYQVYHLSRSDNYYTHIEYPKCGRTWLRYMLCQAQAVKYDIPLRNCMHDICYKELDLPRIYYVHGVNPLKSFGEYSYRRHLNQVGKPKGVIFQVRQPERVMLSYYFASSDESVGDVRNRQVAKCMI